MNDEKLEVLMKYEQKKTDKLLRKYLAFCGQVQLSGVICFFHIIPIVKFVAESLCFMLIYR